MASKYPEDEQNISEHGLEITKHLSGCNAGQEVTQECEVVFVGESGERQLTNYAECQKNPGHVNFIPVSEFTMEHLPEQLRTTETMESIQRRIDATVRIRVSYTSMNRPDTFSDSNSPYPFSKFKGKGGKIARYGTGTINRLLTPESIKNVKCPCPICKVSDNPKTEHWLITVQTSTHVIYDDSEADCATFDCFYDRDDTVGDNQLYGIAIDGTFSSNNKMYRSDLCNVICVTHDGDMMGILKSLLFSSSLPYGILCCGSRADPPAEVIVSHPHGCGKRITIGKLHHVTVPVAPRYFSNVPQRMPYDTFCHIPLNSQDVDGKYYTDKKTDSVPPGEINNDHNGHIHSRICPNDTEKSGDDQTNTTSANSPCVNASEHDGNEEKDSKESIQLVLFQGCRESSEENIALAFYCPTSSRDGLLNSIEVYKELSDSNSLGENDIMTAISHYMESSELHHFANKIIVDNSKTSAPTQRNVPSLDASVDKDENETCITHVDALSTDKTETLTQAETCESVDTRDNNDGKAMSSKKTMKEVLEETFDAYIDLAPYSSEFEMYYGLNKMIEAIKDLLARSHGSPINEFDLINAICPTMDVHFNSSKQLTGVQGVSKENIAAIKSEYINCAAELYEALGFTAEGIASIAEISKGILSKLLNNMVDEKGTQEQQQLLFEEFVTFCADNYSSIMSALPESKPTNSSVQNRDVVATNEIEQMLDGFNPQTRTIFESYFMNGNLEDLAHEVYSKGDQSTGAMLNIEPGTRLKLPDGLTFTLPSEAEYAMLYHNGKEGRFMFPPGTKFHTIDGKQMHLPDDAEFENQSFHPSNSYATYDTATCPGSSGATVYCDLFGNKLMTFFPHSGSLHNINRSGVVDNSLYTIPHNFLNSFRKLDDMELN